MNIQLYKNIHNYSLSLNDFLVFIKVLVKQENFFGDMQLKDKLDFLNIYKLTIKKLDLEFFVSTFDIEIYNKKTGKQYIIPVSKTTLNDILNYLKEDLKEQKLIFESISSFRIVDLYSNPILLYASQNTNFIFKIENIHSSNIDAINTEQKIKDRLSAIIKHGGQIKFFAPEKDIMTHNLKMVDSLMPEIIACVLLVFYFYQINSISKIVDFIHEQGFLRKYINFNEKILLENKIQKFLFDILLGSFTAGKWNGQYDVDGIVIVKDNGDYIAFHTMDIIPLRTYLYNTIKLDTPSTTRHRFGQLYLEKNNKLYFKLNLQLRF